jgi:hypothetical protein
MVSDHRTGVKFNNGSKKNDLVVSDGNNDLILHVIEKGIDLEFFFM